jgi:hypothetical protein
MEGYHVSNAKTVSAGKEDGDFTGTLEKQGSHFRALREVWDSPECILQMGYYV